MDVITQIRLFWLGGLAVLYGVALGTAVLLTGLLHRRAQRRSSLHGSVLRQFPLRLRDQITMQVRGTVWGRRAVIKLDMGSHSPEEWWPIVTRLCWKLPPDVRLLVCYADALSFPVRLSIKPRRPRGQRPAA